MKLAGTRNYIMSITALLLAGASSAALADGEPLKGMILSKEGSTLVVRSGGSDVKIQVTPSTRIRATSGALGLQKSEQTEADLLRGLSVEIETASDGQNLTATEIDFKASDLKTAQQIAAGIHSTEGRVATNEQGIATNAQGVSSNSQRIDQAGEMVSVGKSKVFFATGSTVINPAGKHELQAVAAKAKTIAGSRLVVVGRADSTGNPEANQRLSEKRAAAVQAYLLKSCGVLPSEMMPLSAVGESEIAHDPDPPGTAAEARRVVVWIAVSKSSSAAQGQ
jgi:outer membrane protein OmpA-like peptidoglycan-associated protein